MATCLSCKLMFNTSIEQRAHFKTEFHLFNMKRKKAGLSPITQAQFDAVVEKILIDNTNVEENGDNSVDKEESFDISDDEDVEKLVKERMSDPNTVKQCLFCQELSNNMDENIEHMKESHGFVISLKEYVKDLGELIKYLSVKVYVAHICIFCDYEENVGGRIFKSTSAAQAHMRDLSHCRFELLDNEFEYEKFYDFNAYYQSIKKKFSEDKEGIILPSNKIIVHKDIQLYKRPIRDNEDLDEEEKQLIAFSKWEKIQKTTDVEDPEVRKRDKLLFKKELKGNKVLRKHWFAGININTIKH